MEKEAPRIYEHDQSLWEAWAKSLYVDASTIRMYRQVLAQFYKTLNKSIYFVTEEEIEQYREAMQAEGKALTTIRRHLSPIRQYWKFAQTRKANDVYKAHEDIYEEVVNEL